MGLQALEHFWKTELEWSGSEALSLYAEDKSSQATHYLDHEVTRFCQLQATTISDDKINDMLKI